MQRVILGGVVCDLVGFGGGYLMAGPLARPRYEFHRTSGANALAIWKVDRRTGETFLCAHYEEHGYVAGAACLHAKMPSWYVARGGR